MHGAKLKMICRIIQCSEIPPTFPTIKTRPEKIPVLYFCLILKLTQADTVCTFTYPYTVNALHPPLSPSCGQY
jgi:hypothetical protein